MHHRRVLCSSAPWYFLQYHQRYSIQCTTQVTHAITPTTLPKLICKPCACNPWWHVTHASCQPRNPRQHTTHASTLLTQACHPQHSFQYAPDASTTTTPSTLARHSCKYVTNATHVSTKQHVISQTPTNAVLFQCFYFTIIPNDGDDSKCATFVQSAQLNHGFMVKSFDFFKVFQLLQLSSLSRQTLNFQVMLVSYERINQLDDWKKYLS